MAKETKEGDQPKEGEDQKGKEQTPAAPAPAAAKSAETKSTEEVKSEPKFEKTMDLRFKKKSLPLKDGGIREALVLQQKHKNLDPEGKDRWEDIPMDVE